MTLYPFHRSPACGAALLLGGAVACGGSSATMASSNPSNPTVLAAAQPGAPAVNVVQPEKMLVFVGTYTRGDSQGIYRFTLELASGKLTPVGAGPKVENPSFLALHPSGRFLYAVNEIGNFAGTKSGAVSAFAVAPRTGELTLLNQQSSVGGGPCHLVVDRAGKNVLVANYGGGSVAVLPIRPDGRLGEATASIQHVGSSVNPRRQEAPRAHSINMDAANRFAFAADLGVDKVFVYRFDPERGTLAPHDPPAAVVTPGAGPRHFAFRPNGNTAYVINEIDSTVTVFDYDATAGTLKTLQTLSTLPKGFEGQNSTAEVLVHPSGKFLYGSNRGHDSIALFRIDADTGQLTPAGHQPTGGKTPRNFGIDPTGTYLLAANQGSNNIVVFRINPETGALTPTGHTAEVPLPVCVRMMPVGQ